MPDSPSIFWFVIGTGPILGPFTKEEFLHQHGLLPIGNIQYCVVGEEHWRPLYTHPDFEGSSITEATPVPRRNPSMLLTILVSIAALVLVIYLIGTFTIREKKSTPAPYSVSPGFVPTTPSDNMATSTLTYWQGLNSLPRQMAADMRVPGKSHVAVLRGGAGVIRRNSTLGVDAELTAWAQRMATSLEQRADLIETSRNPATLAEAFIRGTQGDPFGVSIEMNQAERAWLTGFRALQSEQYQLRARLTARYGVEFPPP